MMYHMLLSSTMLPLLCGVLQFMLQDRSVLQYGFLQSGPVANQLSGG
jgi:hypothetical protein